MSMNAYTPVDSHSAATDLSALLQLLTDPVATKARLDELLAQEKATKEQIATLNAMAAETRRLHGTARATEIVLENRKAALDKREEELEARSESISSTEAARSDSSLKRRELAVEARENSAKAEAERLAAMRRDLEGRLGQIKKMASSLG
jgi:hypothetical protein